MPISDGKLRRLRAVSNERGVIAAAAMDQRGNLQKALAMARGVEMKEITPESHERVQGRGLPRPDAARHRHPA